MPQSLNVESLIKNSLSDVEHGRSRGKKETGQTKRREAFVPEKVFFFFLQIFKVVVEGMCGMSESLIYSVTGYLIGLG